MPRSSVLSHATRVELGPDEQESAAAVSQIDVEQAELVLRLPGGQELPLPDALVKVVVASAGELSEGHAVTVLPSEVWLTPAEVGELLGLSRPYVVRLIDLDQLPSENLPESRHRVVRLTDVLEFQARRERRREGRRRLAEAVQVMDLEY
jgi:excisionase family DNA binding protein